MVRFNKKESEARKELLASMNQVNDGKENENGKNRAGCWIIGAPRTDVSLIYFLSPFKHSSSLSK